LSALYEDKLDKKIPEAFYQTKFAEYSAEVEALSDKLVKHTKANINYYEFGSHILELSNKAVFLYKNAKPEEKKELLNFLLSNSHLRDNKVLISYKKPFDKIHQRALHFDMRGVVNLIRTNYYILN
jgi:hypothetical protein